VTDQDRTRAIEALRAGATVAEAAHQAGCSRVTLYRRARHDPALAAALRERSGGPTGPPPQGPAVEPGAAGVGTMRSEALTVLRGILNDPAAPRSERRQAALGILKLTDPAPVPADPAPTELAQVWERDADDMSPTELAQAIARWTLPAP
jgi:transposase-like protein